MNWEAAVEVVADVLDAQRSGYKVGTLGAAERTVAAALGDKVLYEVNQDPHQGVTVRLIGDDPKGMTLDEMADGLQQYGKLVQAWPEVPVHEDHTGDE